MEEQITYESLFKKTKFPDVKELTKLIFYEIETLRIVPFYDPKQYHAFDGITANFETKVLSLVKKSLSDHKQLINNIVDESGRTFDLYTDFIKSEILETIRFELFYLVKMINSNENQRRILGNLVNYSEGSGVELNEESLISYIKKKKLSLTLLLAILRSKNREWLEAYTNLNKELYSYKKTDFKVENKDNPEYYIAAALSFKNKMKKVNKKTNFSLFSKEVGIPRTTLKENLERLKIYNKIKSILKNDGNPSNKF